MSGKGTKIKPWVFAARHHRAGLLAAAAGLSAWGVLARHGLFSWPGMIWFSAWSLAVISLAIATFRYGWVSESLRSDLALAAVLPIQAVTQATGGLDSPWMLAYGLLLLMTAFSFGWRTNAVVLGAIVALETLPAAWSRIPPDRLISPGLIWLSGLILIPVLVKGYTRAAFREKLVLTETLARMKTSAHAIVPPPDIREKQQVHSLAGEDRLNRGMPFGRRFDETVENMVGILKTSLKTSGNCLLLLSERPDLERLRVYHRISAEPDQTFKTVEVKVGEGLLGWIAKEQKPVRLGRLVASRDEFIDSLAGQEKIQSLLAMPLVAEGVLEGMVVADSRIPEAFSDEDENLMNLACREILRALHDMRDRGRVQEKAMEFSTLLDVSRALSSKLDLRHRLETMADRVRQSFPYDHGLIFLVDEGERHARLAVSRGLEDSRLEGESVALRDGTIGMIVKNRQPVLFPDLRDRKRRMSLFPSGSRIQISPASFLGLPMIVEDRVIGVFVIASKKPNAFDGRHMIFLETLCHQAALSISDAQLHDQVARLAVMDGLTGVLNHRKFQERLAEEFERQDRHRGSFSLVMLDVDHFKRINDTYGHPVGDQVLKKLASVLSRTVRKIDTVARYGGEEFALLLSNAGREEAFKLADRIRRAIEETRFETGSGTIPVTVSMGVATFPQDTRRRPELIDRADQALYAAKKSGRNRVFAFSEIPSPA